MRHRVSRALAASAAVCALVLAPARPAQAAPPEWNVARVGAPASAAGVLVAVVDTGIDAAHPAFAGRIEPAIDLMGGNGGDPNGHGTHVAGTVAGADAGCGSIGVAPDARLLPVRVLDANGEGTVDVVAEGIRRAADAGAVVINLSLGADVVLRNVAGSGLRDAIEYAWAKGSIPVLAAGNDGLVGGLFGSGYGDLPAVVVTATDNRDQVAPYATSIGSAEWGIAAPGGDTSGEPGRDVLSAFPDRKCALNAGTSMAAPHVSGALAALRASGLDRRQAVERLLATARDLGAPGVDGTYGHGLVDLRAALDRSAPAPPAPVTTVAGNGGADGGGSEPSAAPVTTQAPRRGAPTPDIDPTADPAPADPSATSVPSTTGGGSGDGPETSRSTGPDGDDGGGGEGAAGVVATGDGDEDDDGVPGALVAVAVAALGIAGAGSGVAARRLRRRG